MKNNFEKEGNQLSWTIEKKTEWNGSFMNDEQRMNEQNEKESECSHLLERGGGCWRKGIRVVAVLKPSK